MPFDILFSLLPFFYCGTIKMMVSPLKNAVPSFLFNSPSMCSSASDNTRLMWMSNERSIPRNCLPFFNSIKILLFLDSFNKSIGLLGSMGLGRTGSYISLFLFFFPMARSQARSKRKASGGRYRDYRKKKFFELARTPSHTKVGSTRSSVLGMRGGGKKFSLLSCDVANVYDPAQKKYLPWMFP